MPVDDRLGLDPRRLLSSTVNESITMNNMDIHVDLDGRGLVQGHCDRAFEAVANAFIENFRQHAELGASVSVRVGGSAVLDLWGGLRVPDTHEPWTRDTVSVVFSCTKAATALCAQILIDRGQLELDAPMSRYWPEFAQAGKDGATVRMALNHSVGVPALREPVKPGGYCDWDYMVERLSREAPFWAPGTRNGYHMSSFGWVVGELVRRVSGQSLGTFFRNEVAQPLGMDFWIGLPEEIEPRVAPMIRFVPPRGAPKSDFTIALITDPKSIPSLAWSNNGGHQTDLRESHAAELGGGGGISNARALARMYQPLANGGEIDGIRLLSRERIEDMRQLSMSSARDETLLIPTRFGQGFMLCMDNHGLLPGNAVRIGKQAFGHVGAGGSIGFADPQHQLSFGYTMNRMGGGLLLNERGQSLVDAAYSCLGA